MDAGEIGQQSSFPTIFQWYQWYQYSAPASAPTMLQRDSENQDSPSSVGNQDSSLKKKGKYKSYSLEMKSSIMSSIENGKKISKVAEILSIPKSTVSAIKRKYEEKGQSH
eukprot:TRINITY_DN111_c0_g1_i13.p2 TRINITY_DN111_c0_g1~~TRINITY_DN111_c0_g1_i13.p2  ORF type:complete len:110 (+),score=33.93 TRINITY_DN111_c0_g1_i13:2066-2395(+)